ncbi:GDSL esterase/lipase 7-like [Macadamia integrifolia]|uniref:GDSL esterase/lipase 7-like n=1 Tax=Macadamia integrifolia TaxID=60698 RepID=UPI001C5011ED|nr:GDSL esterase/lipase 7-like [Macadamia integrifolia]
MTIESEKIVDQVMKDINVVPVVHHHEFILPHDFSDLVVPPKLHITDFVHDVDDEQFTPIHELLLLSQVFLNIGVDAELRLNRAKCSSPLAPALYIFGDSLSDSGNNNFLQTLAKVNYTPYGIDFPDGPTGRFTNGKTFVDFISQFLGLPFVPPYMGLSVAQKNNTITGMNYASGSAGILRETGTALGKNLGLGEQVELFKETVNNYLPKNFKTKDELLQYLSKSIFIVHIGSNDYINNYLLPAPYNSSHLYNPEQFAGILLKELKQHLQELYNLGARKFLVVNLPSIGCARGTIGCVNPISQMMSLYNKGFPSVLQDLSTTLQGSTFVQGDIDAFSLDLGQNAFKYGFTNLLPCCTEILQCLPNIPPCLDRTRHIFWDGVHPTQQVNLLFANGCFNNSTLCTPINVQQLALKQ